MKLHDKMQLNMAMDVDVHAGRPRAAAAPRVANLSILMPLALCALIP